MSGIATIARRELSAYFRSPIGYILLIVFLALSVGLFITPFFTYPRAEMRDFFFTLPVLLCIFLPAVTMRSWAEEKSENTIEMLLTFPMKPHELVLGKFFSSMIFYLLALTGTLTIPLMLIILGNPDMGAIFSAYLGAVAIGAFYIAMGLFFSGLCKDQIVAFTLTLMAAFGVFLLGTTFISSYIDDLWPGLGTLLSELVGVIGHYRSFARGVIEIADIIYFLTWIAIFLFLNGLFLEGRGRPRAQWIFTTSMIICIGIGLMLNYLIAGRSLGRFDLTEDKIFTLSDASKKILSSLKVPVQVKLYITPKNKMPTEMKSLEQDILSKLEEMRLASGSKLQYRTIHMEAANILASERHGKKGGRETEEAIEKRLLDKGVRPFSVRTLRKDQAVTQLVYSSIGIAYLDKPEVIIPRIVPGSLFDLEYRMVSTIYKLTLKKKPIVAMVAPTTEINLPQRVIELYKRMGRPIPKTEDPFSTLQKVMQFEKYDVRRVSLTKEDPLPEQYDTLVILNPRGLNERQRWEINKALVEGKPVLMGIQMYSWDYRITRGRLSLRKIPQRPGINELLNKFGLGIDTDILMDENHQTVTIADTTNPLRGLFGGGLTLNLATQIRINPPSMNRDYSITSRLGPIFYLWGSAITIDDKMVKKAGLSVTRLMSTSPRSWTVPADRPLTQRDLNGPRDGLYHQYPVMVLVEGQFPDTFNGKGPPKWPEEAETPKSPEKAEEDSALEPKPGRMILIGAAQPFNKYFLARGNLDLFMNSIDALSLGEDLIHIRSKKPIDRTIDKPSDSVINLWKFINLGLVNLLIALTGFAWAIFIRRSREAYLEQIGR